MRYALLVLVACSLTAAERPSLDEIRSRQTVELRANPRPDGLQLHWNQPNRPPSDGIKVVLSTEHDQPVHPFDPFVHWVAGTGHSGTFIPSQRLMDLSGGRPFHLRLVFVHQEDHEDPRRHVAYSSTIHIVPRQVDAAELAADRDTRARFPQGRNHEGEDLRPPLRDRLAAMRHARHAPSESLPAAVPPPAELADPDLTPTERDLLGQIHELEVRKHELERRLAQAGQPLE